MIKVSTVNLNFVIKERLIFLMTELISKMNHLEIVMIHF